MTIPKEVASERSSHSRLWDVEALALLRKVEPGQQRDLLSEVTP